MPTNFEVLRKLGENLLPLSPLAYEQEQHGWTEERLEVSMEGQARIIRVVHWPEQYTSKLQPVPKIDIPSPLPIRLITQGEINQGLIVMPDETWNLANFNSTNYKTNDVYGDTLLPAVEAFATQLGVTYPGIKRSQICFSRVEGRIIVLPFMRYE